jgi:hypothetical protein
VQQTNHILHNNNASALKMSYHHSNMTWTFMSTPCYCLYTVLSDNYFLTSLVYIKCVYATLTYLATNQPGYKASLFEPTSDLPTNASGASPMATTYTS